MKSSSNVASSFAGPLHNGGVSGGLNQGTSLRGVGASIIGNNHGQPIIPNIKLHTKNNSINQQYGSSPPQLDESMMSNAYSTRDPNTVTVSATIKVMQDLLTINYI
jgi:hypothetical protein